MLFYFVVVVIVVVYHIPDELGKKNILYRPLVSLTLSLYLSFCESMPLQGAHVLVHALVRTCSRVHTQPSAPSPSPLSHLLSPSILRQDNYRLMWYWSLPLPSHLGSGHLQSLPRVDLLKSKLLWSFLKPTLLEERNSLRYAS